MECGISLPISGNRDSEINIDGLPDYRVGESADIEQIEFFTDAEEESQTATIVLHDAPLRFSLYPVPVSQCHVIGRKTFMLINENYIEFSISIWRNVPVVNTKLYRFSSYIATSVNWGQGRMVA